MGFFWAFLGVCGCDGTTAGGLGGLFSRVGYSRHHGRAFTAPRQSVHGTTAGGSLSRYHGRAFPVPRQGVHGEPSEGSR